MMFEATINGEPVRWHITPSEFLTEALRRHGLIGTKRGCETGDCGTCSVLLDGREVNSCILLAAQASGHEILTIEGVARGREPHPVQEAFVDKGAVQCGFCTPGMIMSAKAFIDRTLELPEEPTRPDVRQALSGNLCRCTGYQKIVDAVLSAYTHLRQEEATHV